MSDKIVEPLKKYKTKYDTHVRIHCASGDREVVVRKPRNINGTIRVDDTKEMFPLAEYINSFEESCNIETLLKRFQAGDMSVMDLFMQKTPQDYIDLSNIPDNFNDMMALVNDSKIAFNELPAEVKAKFDNNFELWASSVNSKEWMEKMGYGKTVEETAPAAETAEGKNSSAD